jgi:hypothetical protein
MNFETELHLQHGDAPGSTVSVTMLTDSAPNSSKNRNPRDPPERRSLDPREAMASATSPSSIGASPKNLSEQRMPSPTLSPQRQSFKHLPNSDELLCDYDSAPSTLYSLLEASHWTLAATRCKTHPSEVRTWVVRRDRETNDIRWTLLPLHAAVIFQSPTSVVEVILEHYPQGASRPDDQGMLPLHLAFRHKKQQHDEQLLEVLLTRYPEAVRATDVRGRTPIDLGRDAMVSTTFMRRYTNTCVQLAVAAATMQSRTTAADCETTTSTTPTTASSYPQPETSSSLLYETSLSKIKQDYALQITRLNDVYENRITRIEQTHQDQLQKLQEEARVERQNLVTLHYDEMKCLHEVVASTHDHENAHQTNQLTLELEAHKSDLERCEAQKQLLEKELKKRTAFLSDVKETVSAMAQDLVKLQSVVERQQEELEAAQSMRMHLLRTLLQQENDDAPNLAESATQVQNLLAATKSRVEDVSKKLMETDTNNNDNGNKVNVVVADEYEGSYEEVAPIQDDDISAITDHSNNYLK